MKTAFEHVVIMLEGFLILVMVSVVGFGMYWFFQNVFQVPLYIYSIVIVIGVASYGIGRLFEMVT